ncbi:MAG: folate-binding protein YgfZ [Candidatus Pelagibacterales bacterium]|nr:MAG: folate-binding protein YgfZ [Pelagibacterales bacterium]
MEKNETTILDDRGFVKINGDEAKSFLQNIVTNNIEKITDNFTLFSSIFTPQGKYLYEFFILKFEDGYLLECEKKLTLGIIEIFNFYKLRSKVNLIDVSKKYTNIIISLEKFKEITKTQHMKDPVLSCKEGSTLSYENERIYLDSRHKDLGAKIITKIENTENIIKKLDLKKIDKKNYYEKSFALGIPQLNLDKLKNKIFGIENNLDELSGIDFKKGCYIGQENTSRIKLRNKLRRRILPVKKIEGEIFENDIIKYKDIEIGKIMIDKPYSYALIKIVEPNLSEFINAELTCGVSKVKILKPNWIS